MANTATDTAASTDSTTGTRTISATRRLRWGATLIAVSGLGLLANALVMLYRAMFDPGFEAGVHDLGGVTRGDLAETHHEVVHYIDHLHVNVAGLMAASGIAMVALAWYGVRRGKRWALATAVTIPVVFLAHSLPVHQTADFSFDALAHMGPGFLWVPALLVGSVLAYAGMRTEGASAGRD